MAKQPGVPATATATPKAAPAKAATAKPAAAKSAPAEDIKAKAAPAEDMSAKAAKAMAKLTDPVKKAGKAVKESTERAVKRTAALNVAVIDHAESNTREAFAAMRQVAAAESVKDIVKIQTKFVRDQSERSVKQVRELGDMIAQFGREAMEQMRGK
jgi:phasin family protein